MCVGKILNWYLHKATTKGDLWVAFFVVEKDVSIKIVVTFAKLIIKYNTMNTLELDIRNKLLAEIKTEALSIKAGSVINLLSEMLVKLKSVSKTKHCAKDFYGVWKDDAISDEEFLKELKSSRKFKNEIESEYE